MEPASGMLSERVRTKAQIMQDDIVTLASAGVTLLVCHRPDNEEIGQPTFHEIAETAKAHGISAMHVPVSGLPSPQAVEATRRAITAMAPEDKAVFYCRSGMRSAAAWAMAERLRGANADDLRAAAAAAGYDLSSLPL